MEIQTGQYAGFFKFNNQRVQNNLGRSQTFFDIEITEVDGAKFKGTVKEEPAGQPGSGIIQGSIFDGEKIAFVKQMPIAHSITPDGQQKTYNARHPKIYYEGFYENNKFWGTWRIKFGFIFDGYVPIPVIPISGK